MMSTLSVPLGLSPLSLVAITIATESGQPICGLIKQVEGEIAELAKTGVLEGLYRHDYETPTLTRSNVPQKCVHRPLSPGQAELCFNAS